MDITRKFRSFCERHGGTVVHVKTEPYLSMLCRGVRNLSDVDPSEVLQFLANIESDVRKYGKVELGVEGADPRERFRIASTYDGKRREIHHDVHLSLLERV